MITPDQETAIYSILRRLVGQSLSCNRCDKPPFSLHACQFKFNAQDWKDRVGVEIWGPIGCGHRLLTKTLRLAEVNLVANGKARA